MTAADLTAPIDAPALYFIQQTAALRAENERLKTALYLALPYVEDHESSPIYKPQAVAQAVAHIRKALGEPTTCPTPKPHIFARATVTKWQHHNAPQVSPKQSAP